MKACHDHVMNLDKKAPAKPPRVFLRIVVVNLRWWFQSFFIWGNGALQLPPKIHENST